LTQQSQPTEIAITTEEYFNHDQFAIDVFNRKYALDKPDGTKETPGEVFWRIATYIASVEPDKASQQAKALKWFSMMFNREFIPGGRIIYGAGNTDKTSLINCTGFALGVDRNGDPIEADSLEGIFEAAYITAKVSSRGEGLGYDMTALRPAGSPTHNAAKTSTGAVSWMQLFSQTTGLIAAHNRRGALLLCIDDNHPDIEEFITVKSDYTKIQSANISIKISNAFFEAYKKNATWDLTFDNKIYKTIKARKLMKLIAQNAYEHAEPGLLYWSTSQRMSNSDAIGYPIASVNGCSEEILSNGSSCVLSNINLADLPIDLDKALVLVESRAGEILHFLDNTVSCQLRDDRCPTVIQRKDLEALRRVGVGYTGLADYLLRCGIAYDSDRACDIAEQLTRAMCIGAYKQSIKLAKEREPYPAWDDSTISSHGKPWCLWKVDRAKHVISQHPIFKSGFMKHLIDSGTFQYSDFEYGMRNVCCLTIPPVGTGSIILKSSSGVEPIMDTWYYRRTRVVPKNYPYEWRWQLILHPVARQIVLERTGIDPELLSTDQEKIALMDSAITKKECKVAHEINWRKKISLMEGIQKWIDASVSVTYNLNENNASPAEIEKIYIAAYEHNLKGCSIYVQRNEGRVGIILFDKYPTDLDPEYQYNFSAEYINKYGHPYAQ
jgi:ribonucleoside-diphosphate reductase alpha chain